jgi:hypothetical protein
MIFDRLWRAERKDAKALKELRQKYKPELNTAEKKGWEEEREELAEYIFAERQINEAECLRTRILVKKARRLGVAVPPTPSGYEDNDDWDFNTSTGDFTLRRETELRLTREIRKEEIERTQHRTRWVSLIIGLIGIIMGLISLIHALRK